MRRKPGQKETTKWIHPKPDEVASFGPVTIIRYGRHVLLSNKSTPEQHQEFLSRSAEANQRNCGVVYYQRGVRQSGGRNEVLQC
jgi:hypothetical protein